MRQRLLAGLILSLMAATSNAASFTPLGDLSGGDFDSRANGISADGTVVVGESFGATTGAAFRWTSAGGMVSVSDGIGLAVSADGTTVVGVQPVSASWSGAFRWTDTSGAVNLGLGSVAFGVSGDGSVVVGVDQSVPGVFDGVRWTSEGKLSLGTLNGAPVGSTAEAVSDDGTVIVGQAFNGTFYEAFRWTSTGGMVGLGQLAGGQDNSEAMGVSGNGAVVVGRSISGSGNEAFRWTSGGGIIGLGDLPDGNFSSAASDASFDGSVVVGYGTSPYDEHQTPEAFVWTQSGGMERLLDVLIANGATGLTGWTLVYANTISSDGRWIAGTGRNPEGNTEAYLADISLTPIPIPAAVWLLGSAVGMLGWMRRRVA